MAVIVKVKVIVKKLNNMANFDGYINLFSLSGVQFLTVNGQPSIVIPAAKNNLQVTKNERTGTLSCLLGIKAEEVGEAYRQKERENHQGEQGWDESKLTSHKLIRTWKKDFREKLFARLKEQLMKENEWDKLMERMERVLRKDGSEGIPSVDNERGWEKLLWQELDNRSSIGRLSQKVDRNVNVNAAPSATASEAEYDVPVTEDDMPF